jgi:hypothetical protein
MPFDMKKKLKTFLGCKEWYCLFLIPFMLQYLFIER